MRNMPKDEANTSEIPLLGSEGKRIWRRRVHGPLRDQAHVEEAPGLSGLGRSYKPPVGCNTTGRHWACHTGPLQRMDAYSLLQAEVGSSRHAHLPG